eukprot:s438_g4.t1
MRVKFLDQRARQEREEATRQGALRRPPLDPSGGAEASLVDAKPAAPMKGTGTEKGREVSLAAEDQQGSPVKLRPKGKGFGKGKKGRKGKWGPRPKGAPGK